MLTFSKFTEGSDERNVGHERSDVFVGTAACYGALTAKAHPSGSQDDEVTFLAARGGGAKRRALVVQWKARQARVRGCRRKSMEDWLKCQVPFRRTLSLSVKRQGRLRRHVLQGWGPL